VKATDATYSEDYGLYLVDCEASLTVKVTANGKHYLVWDEKSLIHFVSLEDCALRLEPKLPTDISGIDIVFGTSALAVYCQTFNLKDGTISFYDLAG
jgi:hypothetical protein